MTQYVGRISLKHLVDRETDVSVEDEARGMVLAFVADSGVQASCFVFELGSINEEPHLHFYFESSKSRATLVRMLKRHFELPEKVRMNAKSIHICSAFIQFKRSRLMFCVFVCRRTP